MIKDFIENTFFTGESGGGFVKVKINGFSKIIDIIYEESPLIKEDLKIFTDLIKMAFNNAMEKLLSDEDFKSKVMDDHEKVYMEKLKGDILQNLDCNGDCKNCEINVLMR